MLCAADGQSGTYTGPTAVSIHGLPVVQSEQLHPVRTDSWLEPAGMPPWTAQAPAHHPHQSGSGALPLPGPAVQWLVAVCAAGAEVLIAQQQRAQRQQAAVCARAPPGSVLPTCQHPSPFRRQVHHHPVRHWLHTPGGPLGIRYSRPLLAACCKAIHQHHLHHNTAGNCSGQAGLSNQLAA